MKVLDKRKKMGQLKPQFCRVKTKIREMSVETPASSGGGGSKAKSGTSVDAEPHSTHLTREHACAAAIPLTRVNTAGLQ